MKVEIRENLYAIVTLLSLLCLLIPYNANSANRYLVSGGNGNWNSTSNWSASSGGSSGASFPVTGDVVYIDSNSLSATIHVNVVSACKNLVISNSYTGTFSLDTTLTLSGSVTLGSGMTLNGTGKCVLSTGANITSSGKSFPNLSIDGYIQNYYIYDTLRVANTLYLNLINGSALDGAAGTAVLCNYLVVKSTQTLTSSVNIIALNGLTVNGNANFNGSGTVYTNGLRLNATLTGASPIRLTGGVWSGKYDLYSSNVYLQGDCTIQDTVYYRSGTLTYVSGTITTTGSTLISNNWASFNCGGMSFNNCILSTSGSYFGLYSDLNVSGVLVLKPISGGLNFSGSYNVNCGNLILIGGGGFVLMSGDIHVANLTTLSNWVSGFNGSSFSLYTGGLRLDYNLLGDFNKVVFNGKGTFSCASGVTFQKSIDINTSDTLTISGNITYNSGFIKHLSGTVITTGSTLTINTSCNFNTSGMYWDNITLTGSTTSYGLYSDLNLKGTLSLNAVYATAFSGAYNINVGNLTINSQHVVTVPAGLTVSKQTSINANTTLNGSFTLYTGGLYSGGTLSGTFSGIVFNSKGTWSGATTITKPLTINTADTLAISGTVATNGTFTYTSGNVDAKNGTFSRSGTFNPTGINWGNITITGNTTLTADCNMTGTLTVTAGPLNGSYNYNVGGGFSYTGTGALTGASSILLNGKGTISVTNSAGSISAPLTINTTDTITIGTNFRINNCPFTFTAGKIRSTGSIFETAGTASTININATGFNLDTYLGNVSQTFGGTEGFTMQTFSSPTAGKTFVFKAGKTYTINKEISITGTAASHTLLKSDTPGTKAIVTVSQGATEDLGFCDATDIDSSLGKTVLTYKGNRSNTSNWNLLPTTVKTGAYTFN